MAGLVNRQTDQDPRSYINSVKNNRRREDALQLLDLMTKLTRKEARMWGKSIIGFGKYSYQRKDGKEFEWFNVGFSPGSKHMSVYFMFDLEQESLLQELGPHTNGRGCLYIKKLDEVNMDVLSKLIIKSDRWKR